MATVNRKSPTPNDISLLDRFILSSPHSFFVYRASLHLGSEAVVTDYVDRKGSASAHAGQNAAQAANRQRNRSLLLSDFLTCSY
jgi:hypothetical protein